MYRYSVDHALTYTPDDLVLFRESPFAVWMERLTLENPEHGIPPDLHSTDPADEFQPQSDIVATLRAEGRHVAQIDWDTDEADRRTATLAAMREGADFIVDGVLASGAVSGNANLLMRTSGYSELGDFLYIPCETRGGSALHSSFRLSFMADLLQTLQGQLPPQMLIIRDGGDVQPLQTEDYIYYYRAVKKRFMDAMAHFRKHRMPDPAESAHFGRWSECASEVLKQRALRETEPDEAVAAEEEAFEVVQQKVASGGGPARSFFDSQRSEQGTATTAGTTDTSSSAAASSPVSGSSETLAEQARLLTPGRYGNGKAPGHTPNLACFGQPRPVSAVPERPAPIQHRRSADEALRDLEFIGRTGEPVPGPISEPVSSTPPAEPEVDADAPPASLRESPKQPLVAPQLRTEEPELEPQAVPTVSAPEPTVSPPPVMRPLELTDVEPGPLVFLPPDEPAVSEPPPVHLSSRGANGSKDVNGEKKSMLDMDGAPAPSLAPVVQRAEAEFERIGMRNPMFKSAEETHSSTKESGVKAVDEAHDNVSNSFSNSLITSEEFDDS